MKVLIEVNRYTIKKLEKAIEIQHKDKESYNVYDYVDIINFVLDKFCSRKDK